MAGSGLLERRVESRDGRRKNIVLSAHGETLLATVESIYRDLEQEWAESIGSDRIDTCGATSRTCSTTR